MQPLRRKLLRARVLISLVAVIAAALWYWHPWQWPIVIQEYINPQRHRNLSAQKPMPLYDGRPGIKAGEECINPKDGAMLVWVPAGEFLMGTSATELAAWLKGHPTDKREDFLDEMPQHKVYLDAYYIYQTEVTVAQYRKFCKATGRTMPSCPYSNRWQDTHPIVNVSWYEATSYALWAGAALPTEAQWEKAARGTDGRVYPWGNAWDAAKCVNNTQSTQPVGSIPASASPYGCLDMAGNADEWCADWYSTEYFIQSPARNPTGPKRGEAQVKPRVGVFKGKVRVLRGGDWFGVSSIFYRTANRGSFYPDDGWESCGFRCVVRCSVHQ